MATLPPSAGSTPELPSRSWRIDQDVVIVRGVRLALQRIGIAHWQPGVRLRSWGSVPLHREGNVILAPCGADEALWLGAWLEGTDASAVVRLRDLAGGSSSIALPAGEQLTALPDSQGVLQPLTRGAASTPTSAGRLALEVETSSDTGPTEIGLVLLATADWANRARRTPPPLRSGPPPLPPRLG